MLIYLQLPMWHNILDVVAFYNAEPYNFTRPSGKKKDSTHYKHHDVWYFWKFDW